MKAKLIVIIINYFIKLQLPITDAYTSHCIRNHTNIASLQEKWIRQMWNGQWNSSVAHSTELTCHFTTNTNIYASMHTIPYYQSHRCSWCQPHMHCNVLHFIWHTTAQCDETCMRICCRRVWQICAIGQWTVTVWKLCCLFSSRMINFGMCSIIWFLISFLTILIITVRIGTPSKIMDYSGVICNSERLGFIMAHRK